MLFLVYRWKVKYIFCYCCFTVSVMCYIWVVQRKVYVGRAISTRSTVWACSSSNVIVPHFATLFVEVYHMWLMRYHYGIWYLLSITLFCISHFLWPIESGLAATFMKLTVQSWYDHSRYQICLSFRKWSVQKCSVYLTCAMADISRDHHEFKITILKYYMFSSNRNQLHYVVNLSPAWRPILPWSLPGVSPNAVLYMRFYNISDSSKSILYTFRLHLWSISNLTTSVCVSCIHLSYVKDKGPFSI